MYVALCKVVLLLTTQILPLYWIVTTKALAIAVFLYHLLVSGSVDYPMPYASCLAPISVVTCCSSSQLILSLREFCLSLLFSA